MILNNRSAVFITTLTGVWFALALPTPISTVRASLEATVLSEIEDCLVDDEWVCEYFDQRETWVDDYNLRVPSASDASDIRNGSIPFWESQMVNRLPLTEGGYRVVFEDIRKEQDYSFSFDAILDVLRKNTSIEAVVGKCEDYPEANCISLEDFSIPENLSEQTIAYCIFEDSHRRVAFKQDDQPPHDYLYFHEFGHALGLSHKFNSGGVMSQNTDSSYFNWAELSVIQDAYPRKVVEIKVD